MVGAGDREKKDVFVLGAGEAGVVEAGTVVGVCWDDGVAERETADNDDGVTCGDAVFDATEGDTDDGDEEDDEEEEELEETGVFGEEETDEEVARGDTET